MKCNRPFTSPNEEYLHNQLLSLQHVVLLQHFEVVLLIGGMLVYDEDVRVQFGDDEAQIKLPKNLHLLEHILAGTKRNKNINEQISEFMMYARHNMDDTCIRHYFILNPFFKNSLFQGFFGLYLMDLLEMVI